MSRGVLEQLVIVNVKVELSVADDSATQPMETGTWKFAFFLDLQIWMEIQTERLTGLV